MTKITTTLRKVREAELRAAEKAAPNEFERYWAGSAAASVLRDYAAGRFTVTRRDPA